MTTAVTFKHILVPLDGTPAAEAGLVTAVAIARKFNGRLTLLTVLERDAPVEVHGQPHLAGAALAENYLRVLAQQKCSGTEVDWHVHTDMVRDVAQSLTDHVREYDADLIVMSPHGAHFARNMWFGSIGQQILRATSKPVLIVRTDNGPPSDFQKILVPVSVQRAHDFALDAAMAFSTAFCASLDLLTVVPTTSALRGPEAAVSSLLPRASAAILAMAEDDARDHLSALIAEHMTQIPHVESHTVRGDPARKIASVARRLGSDLVVLGTHCRIGSDAFWAGSVAPRVMRLLHRPVLLVPPRQSVP